MAQLSGYVSEHAAYHHGEASLQSTIVGMAQSFVGSNNINLLAPKGQFGTRLQVGQPAGSPWLSAHSLLHLGLMLPCFSFHGVPVQHGCCLLSPPER